MATITPSWTKLGHGTYLLSWIGAATADTIVAADTAGSFGDKSAEIIAQTAGGATVTIEGSNISATTLRGLNDPQGVAISTLVSTLVAILENTRYVAPVLSGGTGDNWDIHILIRGIIQKN